MKYELEHDDNISVLTIKNDKLDSTISPELKSQIIIVANATEQEHLILDLCHVEFADSSGLSALLLAHRMYRDTNRQLILCNVSDRVKKLIEISQLNQVFSISSDTDSAKELIRSAA